MYRDSRRRDESPFRTMGRRETRVWHPHRFGAQSMTHALIGFFIALAVGLTGIGGGSFTVPALLVLAGLTAGEAVGTAFLFAGVLRLVAAPFYLVGKHIHTRYLWLLLVGAVPGLLVGIFMLRIMSRDAGSPVVILILGAILTFSSLVTFVRRAQNPSFARRKDRK